MQTLPVLSNRSPPPPCYDHISHSSLSLYASCSLRHWFRYTAKLPEESVSAAVVLGSALHAAVEHHFRALLAGEGPPSHDVLLDVFWADWNARDQDIIRFSAGEDANSVGKLADRMLVAFRSSEFARPHGSIVAIEEELRGRIIDGVPDLLARLDLVVDEGDAIAVTDFKSTRSAWNEDHVADAATQLYLYYALVQDLADGRPVRLRFAVLTKGKVPELRLHEVPSDPRRIRRATRVAANIWRAMRMGVVFPNPSPMNCPTCPYRAPCREWQG